MEKLKAVYATDKDSVTGLYYPKSEADKVIAEIKEQHKEEVDELQKSYRFGLGQSQYNV